MNGDDDEDDYDGSETTDWILWVEMVEEQSSRECSYVLVPTPTPTSTPTITPTPTQTFTPTPTWTPTPIPPIKCDEDIILTVLPPASGIMKARIVNTTDHQIEIIRTVVTWSPRTSSHRLDWFGVWAGSYSPYHGHPLLGRRNAVTTITGRSATRKPRIPRWRGSRRTRPGTGTPISTATSPTRTFHEVCVDVDVMTTGITCEGICGDYVSNVTPTATRTNTPYAGTPTNTRTRTPTYTRTPTRTFTPTRTNTPYAGTPTNTYTRTPTRTRTNTPTITPTPTRPRRRP